MATPIYKGCGQPVANSGLLSGLGSWFGGSTPAYVGEGQPSATSSGYLGGSTPAYKSSPAAQSASDPFGSGPITIVIPRDVIDTQQ